MMDVTVYKPIIKRVLAKQLVPRYQREDMAQECYVALLEKQNYLKGDYDEAGATVICQTRIADVRRKDTQQRVGQKSPLNVKLFSLSDAKVMHQAMLVASKELEDRAEDQVYKAIATLSGDEKLVAESLYIQGRTREQTATDMGISESAVRRRRDQVIKKLKKYFETEG
jgi:RNA polymerase sigma factor (sigma-70 family)